MTANSNALTGILKNMNERIAKMSTSKYRTEMGRQKGHVKQAKERNAQSLERSHKFVNAYVAVEYNRF